MNRILLALAAVVVTVGAFPVCGAIRSDDGAGSGAADTQTVKTSLDGRPLRAGEDWNSSGTSDSGSDGKGGAAGANGGAAGTTVATLPYGCAGTEQEEPPPEYANPLGGTPQNDFVLKALITPTRGDAGSEVTIDVVAVATPKALAVVAASFYDKDDHGMKAAKFTDETGKARFKGVIPADAPNGWAAIAVTVTTRDNRSAVDILNFVVTGPGCD